MQNRGTVEERLSRSMLTWLQIHPLCPLLTQNSVAKRSIPATWRPKSCRSVLKGLAKLLPCTHNAQFDLKTQQKPQFSICKTEARSRSGRLVPCLPGSKIHPLGPLLAQNSVAKRSIPATWRPKSCRSVLKGLA